MRYVLRVLLVSVFLMTSMNQSFAQAAPAGGGKEDPLVADTMKNIWIVTGVAAAGAVLGLSTLSFVDEPSEHLKNIVTGAAIGVIIGVGVVAYMQASKSKEMYQYGLAPLMLESQEQFSTLSRGQWHQESFSKNKSSALPTFQFTTTF